MPLSILLLLIFLCGIGGVHSVEPPARVQRPFSRNTASSPNSALLKGTRKLLRNRLLDRGRRAIDRRIKPALHLVIFGRAVPSPKWLKLIACSVLNRQRQPKLLYIFFRLPDPG